LLSERVDFFKVGPDRKWVFVNSVKNSGFPWQSITPIQDGPIWGFQFRSQAGEDWYGGTELFIFVESTFVKGFETDDDATLLDINGDGKVEVIVSRDLKRRPQSEVSVYQWTGKVFRKVIVTTFASLFSKKVQSSLK
jgi:hypothetical protein